MNSENLICDICTSHSFEKISDNEYQCKHCGLTKILNNTSKEYIQLINAHTALKQGNYINAEELFDDIYKTNSKNYEALWGKIISRYGIIFIEDNGDIHPTFHDFSERSFLEDKLYKTFLEIVPSNKRNVYLSLSNSIENLRKKYFELVKKETPYDVFISFKQTDEHGNKTFDYNEAYSLYNELREKNFKVFFSPVTLRNKAGDEYEPFIYHALRTAKVLLVYGQKAEYFEATWVKNEWGRFSKMIDEGLKKKGSLIVCYEGMDAYDLPSVLKDKQAINFTNNKRAYDEVIQNINKVIKETEPTGLTTITIKDKETKRKTAVKKSTVEISELGNTSIITTEDENTSLEIANDYLQAGKFKKAYEQYADILKNNKDNPYASMGIILSNNSLKAETDLYNNINIVIKEYDKLMSLLSNFSKDEAEKRIIKPLINILNNSIDNNKNSEYIEKIYLGLYKYNFSNKNELNENLLNYSIKKANYKLFKLCINLIDENDVDSHEAYREQMQKALINQKKYREALEVIDDTLKINEANCTSLYNKLLCYIETSAFITEQKVFELLDELLAYTKSRKKYLRSFYNLLKGKTYDNKDIICEGILKRITENRTDFILEIANDFKNQHYYTKAIKFYNYYLSEDERKEEGYEGLLLCKYNCVNKDDLLNLNEDFTKSVEYKQLLISAKQNNKEKYDEYFYLGEKFENLKKQREIERKNREIELKNKIKEKKEENKRKFKKAFKLAFICLFAICIICTITFVIFSYFNNPNNGSWIAYEIEEGKEVTISRYVLGIKTDTVKLKAFDETYKLINEVKPTCVNEGYKEYKIVYDDINYTFKVELDKISHNYSSYEVTKDPTETKEGTVVKKCNVCEKEEKVSLPVLNSTNYKKEVVKDVTCTEDGTIKYIYTLDSKDIIINVNVPHTGHTLKGYTCGTCNTILDYIIEDDYIYIGEYPQTIKKADVEIVSKIENSDYYLGSDGERYASVTLSIPNFSNLFPIQFNDGQEGYDGRTYYFKVEPIKWEIRNIDNTNYFLFSSVILDNKMYDDNTNNYENSYIRNFLNTEFLNKAFTEKAKSLINDTEVNNTLSSTLNEQNDFVCKNTIDKVFLLSVSEVNSKDYGFSGRKKRIRACTDYAISQNLTRTGDDANYYLRTPSPTHEDQAYYVDWYGDVSTANFFLDDDVYDAFGVCPGIVINIKE